MSTNPVPTPPASWSVRFYRQLMRIYPQEFTAGFGDSVDQAFRDLMRDAFRDRGYLGILMLWFHIVPDFIFSSYELLTTKAGDYLQWSFRLRWMVACSAGFPIGLLFSRLVGWTEFPRDLRGVLLWLILGFLQCSVLTGKHCDRARWILFSAVAAAIGAGLTNALFDPVMAGHVLPAWAIPVLNIPAAIHGAVIGVLQCLAFRKGQLNASRWVVACSVGLYAFWLFLIAAESPMLSLFQHASTAIGLEHGYGIFLGAEFICSLAAGAIFAAVTVVPLERILRIQPSITESEAQTLTKA